MYLTNTTKLLIFVFILIVYYFFIMNLSNTIDQQISKNYYTIDEVCHELNHIYSNIESIQKEVDDISNEIWVEWPEKHLYENTFKWNIFPFMAFGIVIEDNCNKCPHLWNFIRQIPGIKVALLSCLGPGTKLNPHRGWGNHSNHIIRCHFGFKVPTGCYMSVKNNENDDEEIQLHKKGEWITFDDSRIHYAHNPTEEERIVLIIDIQRPNNIAIGNSDIGDTKELLQLIDYFKQKNIVFENDI